MSKGNNKYQIHKMSVLVLGAHGMLGSMVTWYGSSHTSYKILSTSRKLFDAIAQPVDVLEPFVKTALCVVNCIGAIPQKSYSDEKLVQLNTTFPIKLAELCKKLNVPLLHISTNCVFSGKNGDCLETSKPDAEDSYGVSKALGEPSSAVVLRCSIIGPELGSAFGLLEWFLHSDGYVNGFTDHYWNGLTTYELAKQIFRIIDHRDFGPRIQHFYSANTLSKYELLKTIADTFAKPCTINPIVKGEKFYTLKSLASPPSPELQTQIRDLAAILPAYRRSDLSI
jgi:dTDP-4-dehydrorhamnose reductase